VAPIGVLVRPRLGRSVGVSASVLPSIADAAPNLIPYAQMEPRITDREPMGLRTARDRAYLTWRFSRHPTARYGWLGQKGGLIARVGLRRMRAELVVSDLLGLPDRQVIRIAARHSRCRYMAGWFSRGTPERKVAILGGMIPIVGVHTLRLVALPLSDIDLDIFDLDSWDITTSDLELL
jgi:hypothetical protein